VKVFVTGATGYIGHAVAGAFRRAGYEVHGLCRTEEKARALSRGEIHPVLGDLTKPASYAGVALRCGVLVHAAADLAQGMVGPDKTAIEVLLAAGAEGPRPKTLIYTSGVWVYGATGAEVADETFPLSPTAAVAWRPSHEQMVLQGPGVRGLVIRPGCVYGRQGGLTGSWFEGATKGDLSIVGDGGNHWATVHVDDLADAYVRVAESGLSGEVFNVTDRSRHRVRELAEAAGRAVGYKGGIRPIGLDEARKAMGPFADALALDQHVESWKVVKRLGWTPRHGGFVDGVGTYALAWKAAQGAGG
jgi:nucleoside-diphosphate-sugar epimerase